MIVRIAEKKYWRRTIRNMCRWDILARKVLKALLGSDFDGTLISDFFSVYLKLPYRMQKCLVHLLREFHDRGAEAYGTIMSLMQTLRPQGKNVSESLRMAF